MKTPIFSLLCASVSLVAATAITNAIAAGVEIDLPNGGWRYQEKNVAGFAQEVHYPASNVNSKGQPLSALIQGRIAATGTKYESKPARLIVNGVAMPLLQNENGEFSRPYSFGRGSNSIEVRSPDGKAKQVQFFEARADKLQSKMRIVLSWDTPDNDLDLHVISPDGQHVFYGARNANNGGSLDVDVTTGYGPEIYASPSPVRGLYYVFVNYYGAGSNKDIITIAQVAIVTNENTPAEKQQVFSIPMRKAGELTLVKSFMY